jgi:hypothetical protein
MKKLFLLFLTYFPTVLFSQTVEEVDAASDKICNYLGTLDYIESDEIKMDIIFRDPMDGVLKAVPETDAEEFQKRVYYRLQRNCVEFQELLQRLEPHKDDARITSVKPISTISKKELKSFKKTKDFSYMEADGKRTKVTISDGFWQDYFVDNTFSKLTFSWIDANKFELIFIESNNETRSNLSIPGDKYLYEIIERTKGYYIVSAEVEGPNVYQIFKLYY